MQRHKFTVNGRETAREFSFFAFPPRFDDAKLSLERRKERKTERMVGLSNAAAGATRNSLIKLKFRRGLIPNSSSQ